MSDTNWFEITDGVFALALVDRDAPGYSDSWMAPSGHTKDSVTVEAYDMPVGSSWRCQLLSGALNPSSSTSTRPRHATFCGPASTTTTPTESSWNLDVEIAQDPHITDGLSEFLFENDAVEAFFLLGLNDDTPPLAIGRVYLAAGSFGGAAAEDLTATISMLLKQKPSVAFGNA
mgnify:FL=1